MDPDCRQSALRSLQNDMYAATSRGPRDAQYQTWRKFHCWWFGKDVPMLPLTEEKIKAMSSLFKVGGYKSYRNYLSRIREEHIKAGFQGTDHINLVSQKCSRLVLRGLATVQVRCFRLSKGDSWFVQSQG